MTWGVKQPAYPIPMYDRNTRFMPAMPAQRLEHLALAPSRRQRERPSQPDLIGHHGVDEGVERVVAQQLQHLVHVGAPGTDVPVREVGGVEHVGGLGRHLAFEHARHLVRPGSVSK